MLPTVLAGFRWPNNGASCSMSRNLYQSNEETMNIERSYTVQNVDASQFNIYHSDSYWNHENLRGITRNENSKRKKKERNGEVCKIKQPNNWNEDNEWNKSYEICRKFHIALSSDDVAREEACLSAAMFEM